jgi:diacylglycerol kinase
MNKNSRFSLHSRAKSFQYALVGVFEFFRTEHNAWIHLLATVGIVVAAMVVGVTQTEGIALVIAVALVWITEMLNTCIEKAMDVITEEYHEKIKFIKDISAGAVLVAAAAAVLIGLYVFIPKFSQ